MFNNYESKIDKLGATKYIANMMKYGPEVNKYTTLVLAHGAKAVSQPAATVDGGRLRGLGQRARTADSGGGGGQIAGGRLRPSGSAILFVYYFEQKVERV